MKLFNSIQELWNYNEFCPLCKKNREVIVSVGPDIVNNLLLFEKSGNQLILTCNFKNNGLREGQYKINCDTNRYDITNPILDEYRDFYFYIQSFCYSCHKSCVASIDLELMSEIKMISNIGMERESYYLYEEKNIFHIILNHSDNKLQINKCYLKEDGRFIESLVMRLPLMNLDLNDSEKVINKIKTLILFS